MYMVPKVPFTTPPPWSLGRPLSASKARVLIGTGASHGLRVEGTWQSLCRENVGKMMGKCWCFFVSFFFGRENDELADHEN